jgi:hypothetical protein
MVGNLMLTWSTVFYLSVSLFTEHSTALPVAQLMQSYIKMNNENKLGNPGKKIRGQTWRIIQKFF